MTTDVFWYGEKRALENITRSYKRDQSTDKLKWSYVRNKHRWTYGPAYYPDWHWDVQRYAAGILISHVVLDVVAIGDFFMHDNARPLIELEFWRTWLKQKQYSEGIAWSLDLNPIDIICVTFERRIAAKPLLPLSLQDLDIIFLREWRRLPQSHTDKLIASLENRCTNLRCSRCPYTILKIYHPFLRTFFCHFQV